MDPISALLSSIGLLGKAGADIASASDVAKRNEQLIEFQKAIIQMNSSIAIVQAQNASLVQDKVMLEREINAMKSWESEKQRYVLSLVGEDGGAAFSLKESMRNDEPAHYICANCFQLGKKRILCPVDLPQRRFGVVCPDCKQVVLGYSVNGFSIKYAPG